MGFIYILESALKTAQNGWNPTITQWSAMILVSKLTVLRTIPERPSWIPFDYIRSPYLKKAGRLKSTETAILRIKIYTSETTTISIENDTVLSESPTSTHHLIASWDKWWDRSPYGHIDKKLWLSCSKALEELCHRVRFGTMQWPHATRTMHWSFLLLTMMLPFCLEIVPLQGTWGLGKALPHPWIHHFCLVASRTTPT